MKPSKILFLVVLFFNFLTANADNTVKIWIPTTAGGMNVTQASITDPLVEITPKGIYAEVAMTFTINASNGIYNKTDSLEAILNFDLPANSYVHDSWLWLDSVTIIRADIVEKLIAQQTYNNLVKKIRRDPSLLLKTGQNSYSLNVWPLKTDYPRKVKIVYSTPFEWNRDNFIVPVPTGIFRASKIMADLKVNVYHNNIYTSPAIIETQYSSLVRASGPNYDSLSLPVSLYQDKDEMNITYNVSNNGVFFGVYPTATDEGIYQLAINPSKFSGNAYQPKYVTIIIDHSKNAVTRRDIASVKQSLKSFILKNYSEADSFNLFHINTNVVKASNDWIPANAAGIDAALNGLSFSSNFQETKFVQMLKDGCAFSKTRDARNSYVVLVSDNVNYWDTTKANLLVADLKMSGSLSNRVYALNNSNVKGNWLLAYYGSENFLNAICQVSGGVCYSTITDAATGVTSFDMSGAFADISQKCVYNTKSFSVNLPFSGFTYSRYDIKGDGKFSPEKPYFETGRYYGNLGVGSTLSVEYLISAGKKTIQQNINAIGFGGEDYKLTWTNKYLIDLIGLQNNFYKQEILDSSINNRVLCDYTAFIALDNGDTIVFNEENNGNPTTIGEQDKGSSLLKVYPNPFTESLTIELVPGAEEVIIYDMMGRVVFRKEVVKSDKHIAWNGKDVNGNVQPAGLYIITIKTANGREMIKVMKQ